MSGVLCTRPLGPRRVVVAERVLDKGGAELADRSGHEDACPEELGERCGDAGGGGQDQGDAADYCQDRGGGHCQPAFRGSPPRGDGTLLVTGFSFRRRTRAACGWLAFGCSSV